MAEKKKRNPLTKRVVIKPDGRYLIYYGREESRPYGERPPRKG